MWRQPSSAVSGAKRRPASMERTLLSVAFDVDVDFDFDRTPIRRGCPIFRVFCERWEPRTPAAPFLTLTLLLLLQVWNGHSCPLPLTLILTLLGKGGWPTLAPPQQRLPHPSRFSTDGHHERKHIWPLAVLSRESALATNECKLRAPLFHAFPSPRGFRADISALLQPHPPQPLAAHQL